MKMPFKATQILEKLGLWYTWFQSCQCQIPEKTFFSERNLILVIKATGMARLIKFQENYIYGSNVFVIEDTAFVSRQITIISVLKSFIDLPCKNLNI